MFTIGMMKPGTCWKERCAFKSRISSSWRGRPAVFAPRGTHHCYWNPTLEPVRYLLVMTSNIYSVIHEIHHLQEKGRPTLRSYLRSMTRSCWRADAKRPCF